MKPIAMALIALLFASCSKKQTQELPSHQVIPETTIVKSKYLLDTTITKPASLFPSENTQKIVYHLLVTNWVQPVLYSLAIVVGNDTVQCFDQLASARYEYDYDHAKSSKEKDSALSNKKDYFLSQLGGTALQTLDPNDKDIEFYKEDCREVFQSDLHSEGFSKATIDTLFMNFWKYYDGKIIYCLAPPGDDPDGGGGLYAYHPDLKRLVRIYTP
jgi:hypothetical protein